MCLVPQRSEIYIFSLFECCNILNQFVLVQNFNGLITRGEFKIDNSMIELLKADFSIGAVTLAVYQEAKKQCVKISQVIVSIVQSKSDVTKNTYFVDSRITLGHPA